MFLNLTYDICLNMDEIKHIFIFGLLISTVISGTIAYEKIGLDSYKIENNIISTTIDPIYGKASLIENATVIYPNSVINMPNLVVEKEEMKVIYSGATYPCFIEIVKVSADPCKPAQYQYLIVKEIKYDPTTKQYKTKIVKMYVNETAILCGLEFKLEAVGGLYGDEGFVSTYARLVRVN